MRKPFQVANREGWHGEVVHADGRTERRHFKAHRDAAEWTETETLKAKAAQAPTFGGPSGLTLGQMMGEYASRFTINKGGYKAELGRINHYVTAVGLPRLRICVDVDGKRHLDTMAKADEPVAPEGFKSHNEVRLEKRARTYAMLRLLALKKVNRLTTDDMQQFYTVMKSDGLSNSTIQKEIALLKTAFNSAIRVWKWKHFENPCLGIKLGGSRRRFVVLTKADEERLYAALARCDNPQVWPLVELAIVTTLRKETLLTMKWDQVDLETGQAHLWAKGYWVDVTLSPRAIELLKRVPSSGDNRVFTMSANAVKMAWNGVRENALLPTLQYRDLRHVGATFYARAGFSAHQLQKVLAHKSTRMADVYVNLVAGDMQRVLAEAEAKRNTPNSMPPLLGPESQKKHPRPRKGVDAPPREVEASGNVVHLVFGGNRLVRADSPEAIAAEAAPACYQGIA